MDDEKTPEDPTPDSIELVEDVLVKIFDYLPRKELISASTVCPRFNRIIFRNQKLYKNVVLNLNARNPEMIKVLASSSRSYFNLNISQLNEENVGRILNLPIFSESLRKIKLTKFKLSINSLFTVISKFPNAHKIKFDSGNLFMGNKIGLGKLLLPNLEILNFKFVMFSDNDLFLEVKMSELVHHQPHLKFLKFNGCDLKYFFSNLVESELRLQKLSLDTNYIPEECEERLSNFLESQTGLQQIIIKNARGFSELYTIKKILKLQVPDLELVLNVNNFDFHKNEDEDFTCPYITKLKIQSNWSFRTFLDLLPNLKELEMKGYIFDSGCEIAKMRNLKKLKIEHAVFKFNDLKNQSVEEIDIRMQVGTLPFSLKLFRQNPNLQRINFEFISVDNVDGIDENMVDHLKETVKAFTEQFDIKCQLSKSLQHLTMIK